MSLSVSGRSQIPHFALYGENTTEPDPGFLHIEDIAERSGPAGWLIKPHRHGNMFQLLHIEEGEAEVRSDELTSIIRGGAVVTLPSGTVHGFRFKPGTKGRVLTVADQFLQDSGALSTMRALLQKPCIVNMLHLSEYPRQLSNYLALLRLELEQPDHGQSYMLQWLLNALLMTIQRQLHQCEVAESGAGERNAQLLRFKNLLDSHFREQWRIEQYAAALNISASTLNRLCRELLGISAKQLVQQRLLHEVKRRLIYTGEPLEQIAWSLGFKDPAYFSRFFRSYCKQSPSAYRKENNIGNSTAWQGNLA